MDEVDSTDEHITTREPKWTVDVPLHRVMVDLSPEERKRLDDAHQLKVTSYHMLKACNDPKVIPTMKRIYFEACKQYSKTHERLGL